MGFNLIKILEKMIMLRYNKFYKYIKLNRGIPSKNDDVIIW